MPLPLIIIGAGGGGIIAALHAARAGVPVLLLERNGRTGVKILISGGGKCNITHAGSVDAVLSAFTPQERRFLKPSLYSFTNTDVLRLLADHGVDTEARADGRVFPRTGTAKDVMRVFNSLVREAGVTVRLHTRVTGIQTENGSVCGVTTDSGALSASAVIIATGGASYPQTGTTGDGYRWAAELGHTIVPVRPALAPIRVRPVPSRDWQGVALRDRRLIARVGTRRIASWDGDTLFTHEGLSGPCALEISRAAAVAAGEGVVEIVVDLMPGADFDAVDRMLGSAVAGNRQRTVKGIVEAWLPERLAEPFLVAAGVDPQTRGHVLTRESRRAIAHRLKEWSLGTVECIPIERGEVTAGGVALGEVDQRTMASRVVGGLFLCGEVLDIAGPIGGYNLQAAFSTGAVAGAHAAAAVRGL